MKFNQMFGLLLFLTAQFTMLSIYTQIVLSEVDNYIFYYVWLTVAVISGVWMLITSDDIGGKNGEDDG